jgi:hypothetical protein
MYNMEYNTGCMMEYNVGLGYNSGYIMQYNAGHMI